MLLVVFCQRLRDDWEDFECSLGKAWFDSMYSQRPMFFQGIANHSSMYYQDIRHCPAISLVPINWYWAIIGRRTEIMWDSMKKVVPFKGTYIWRGIYDVGKRFIIVLSKLGSHPVVGLDVCCLYQMWFYRCWLHAFCHCHGYILYVAERLSRLLFCFHKWTI